MIPAFGIIDFRLTKKIMFYSPNKAGNPRQKPFLHT